MAGPLTTPKSLSKWLIEAPPAIGKLNLCVHRGWSLSSVTWAIIQSIMIKQWKSGLGWTSLIDNILHSHVSGWEEVTLSMPPRGVDIRSSSFGPLLDSVLCSSSFNSIDNLYPPLKIDQQYNSFQWALCLSSKLACVSRGAALVCIKTCLKVRIPPVTHATQRSVCHEKSKVVTKFLWLTQREWGYQ